MPRPNPTPYIPVAQRTIRKIMDHRVTVSSPFLSF